MLNSENWFELVVDQNTGKVKSDKGWFVHFDAPWSGHYKAKTAIWTELLNDLKGEVNFGTFICSTGVGRQKTLCTDYNVIGYPTLIYFPPADYMESFRFACLYKG